MWKVWWKEMTRITLELSGIKAVVENEDSNADLTEMLALVEQALKGVGFCFDGHLDLTEDEKGKMDD